MGSKLNPKGHLFLKRGIKIIIGKHQKSIEYTG